MESSYALETSPTIESNEEEDERREGRISRIEASRSSDSGTTMVSDHSTNGERKELTTTVICRCSGRKKARSEKVKSIEIRTNGAQGSKRGLINTSEVVQPLTPGRFSTNTWYVGVVCEKGFSTKIELVARDALKFGTRMYHLPEESI